MDNNRFFRDSHNRKIHTSRCRSCNATIVWMKTVNGKNIPVDAGTVEAGDRIFNHEVHTSHFATCPDADRHRRKNGVLL